MTPEELEELTKKMNEEFRALGEISGRTAAKMETLLASSEKSAAEIAKESRARRQHYKEIERETAKLEFTERTLDALGNSAIALTKSLYNGEQGAQVFNEAIDTMANIINAAILLIPGIGIAAKVAATAVNLFAKGVQAANKQSDSLFKAYQGLASSGAAASDGMQGVFQDLQRFGMGIEELDSFTQLITKNSQQLALLSGTASQGRKALAGVSEGIIRSDLGTRLELMGFSVAEINEGIAGYVALQTQIGRAQKMSTEELTQAASSYLREMDALAKATGLQRKDLEAEMERARSEQRFRAKLDEMRASGDARQIAAADELERANAVLAKQAPQLAQGFRDASAGFISSEAAQKFYLSTQGKGTKALQQLTTGQTQAAGALQQIYSAAGQTAENLRPLAKAGAFDSIGEYAELSNLGVRAQTDLNKSIEEARKEQQDQIDAGDETVKSQVQMRQAQRNARDSMQAFIQQGVLPATKAMEALAKTTAAAAGLAPGAEVAEGKGQGGTESSMGFFRGLGNIIKGLGGGPQTPTPEQIGPVPSGRAPSAPQTQGPPGDVSRLNAEDYIQFTGGTGSREHFNKLDPKFAQAFLLMARDYNAMNPGQKLQLNSGYRSPDEQANVDSGTNPRAAPGRSKHQLGLAADIQSEQARFLNDTGLLSKYGFQSGSKFGDPPHIFMREGGIAKGPDSGYPATLHGTEAVVPLPNGKSIPVEITNDQLFGNLQNRMPKTISLRSEDVMTERGTGPTFAGMNMWKGFNDGPLTTSLDTVKTIAERLGAYDRQNQIITDPKTWQDILQSGIATNMQIGAMKIGSDMLPGLREELAKSIEDLRNEGSSTQDAIRGIGQLFANEMKGFMEQLQARSGADGGAEIGSVMQQMIDLQRKNNDISSKILQVSRG